VVVVKVGGKKNLVYIIKKMISKSRHGEEVVVKTSKFDSHNKLRQELASRRTSNKGTLSRAVRSTKSTSYTPYEMGKCSSHKHCQCPVKIKQSHFESSNGMFRPILINKPGRYVFCSNINVAPLEQTSVITITSSNVVLDFKHFYLNQTNPTLTSLQDYIPVTGVTVERGVTDVTITGDENARGKIRNMSGDGILVRGDTSNVTVTNLLITRDEQFPGFLDSDTFEQVLQIGLNFVDVDQDIFITEKLTSGILIKNVTCENYSGGGVISRANLVTIEDCQFVNNAYLGLWLGNTFVYAPNFVGELFLLANVTIRRIRCDRNGFKRPGVVSPPIDTITGFLDTSFGMEANRCDTLTLSDSSFSETSPFWKSQMKRLTWVY
jgi:hypothetical protein